MLSYLAGAIFLSGLMKSTVGSSDAVLTGLVVNNGAQLCGMAACLALVSRRVPGGIRAFVWGEPGASDERRVSEWIEAAGLAVAAVGVCPLIRDVTALLLMRVSPGFVFESHPTLQALEEEAITGIRVVALWMGAAVVAPVAEEIFFRGVLQNFLIGATRRTGLAIVLSGAAFALVHFSQPHALPALFFLGILLGAAYVRTGRLIVPIVIHAVFNLKTLIWETLLRA
jgi:membrane protease YdiL (CAAX protease family)